MIVAGAGFAPAWSDDLLVISQFHSYSGTPPLDMLLKLTYVIEKVVAYST